MTKRRRVLMTADRVGGVWQYANDLARALAPLGWDTTIAVLGPVPSDKPSAISSSCSPAEAGAQARHPHQQGTTQRDWTPASAGEQLSAIEILHPDLPLDWLSTSATPIHAAADTLATLARDLEADLIHLNHPAMAGARYPAPVLVADHGGLAPWWEAANGAPVPADLAWQVELARAGLHAANVVIAPSQAYAASVRRHYALADVIPVHNGRAPLLFPAKASRARHAFTAGRLWDQVKNTPVLDRVAARLSVPFRAAGPLTGPHGQTQPIEHLHHLGLLPSQALAAEYAARPVFVSAARFEPFGLAVLEAAQAGCPLVLADIPSFRELWDGAAHFVPADDAQAYADAIGRLLADADLRAAMEQASQARAARYTPQAMATATAAIYDRLLATNPQPVRAEPVQARVHTPPHRAAA